MSLWTALWAQPWNWARPWAFALLLAPLLLALWRLWLARQQRAQALAYAEPDLLPYATRKTPPAATRRALAFDLLLWGLLACAVAGPRQSVPAPLSGAAAEHRVAVMVLLDVGAQAAQLPLDAPISALEQSRLLLAALWPRLQGERLGLIAYGMQRQGAPLEAVQLLPPTQDAALFNHFAALAQPDLLTAQGAGTALAGVIELARQRLAQQAEGEAGAVLLLAGAQTPIAPDLDARRLGDSLRAAHLPLYVLALPGLDAAQAAALRTMARSSGGAMTAVQPGQTAGGVWRSLYDRGIARITVPQAISPQTGVQWRELFAIFLIPALLLMLWHEWPPRRPRANGTLLLSLAVLTGLNVPQPAHAAAPTPQQAWAAWRAGDDARAQALYAALPGFDARIAEGDSAYRRGQYQQAAQAFHRAVLLADTLAQRFTAFYNLGNACMHLPGKTLEAVQAYEAALRIRPQDANALRNARLAQRQYEIDHPPAYLVGIAKRAPAIHHSRFGQQASDTPSQLRKAPPRPASAPLEQAARLAAQGQLGDAAATAAKNAAPWQPPQRDWAAVDKRARLLQDATLALWQQRADIDTRAARDATRQTGARP
jgi:Ca-activated chloride channel family protein